jgi:hypothetical protein
VRWPRGAGEVSPETAAAGNAAPRVGQSIDEGRLNGATAQSKLFDLRDAFALLAFKRSLT